MHIHRAHLFASSPIYPLHGHLWLGQYESSHESVRFGQVQLKRRDLHSLGASIGPWLCALHHHGDFAWPQFSSRGGGGKANPHSWRCR